MRYTVALRSQIISLVFFAACWTKADSLARDAIHACPTILSVEKCDVHSASDKAPRKCEVESMVDSAISVGFLWAQRA